MSSRGQNDTASRVLIAFVQQRTWSQADLARHVGVETRALRRVLAALQEAGVPLEREEDHPHVYWSAPKTWFPGGVILSRELVGAAARLLARAPRTRDRERILEALLTGAAVVDLPRSDASADVDEHLLAAVEDGLASRRPLRVDYFSAARGDRSSRNVSVHYIAYAEHTRFAAICHRTDDFKWFRVDRVSSVRADPGDSFRGRGKDEVAAFVATTVAGFRAPGDPEEHRFFVRAPESRWVTRNLPSGLVTEPAADGAYVYANAAALDVVARIVVGLGAVATCETAELAQRVAQLAREALRSARSATARVNTRSGGRKQPTE